ncbi:hypothetical protein [Kluyvera georgiana]
MAPFFVCLSIAGTDVPRQSYSFLVARPGEAPPGAAPIRQT